MVVNLSHTLEKTSGLAVSISGTVVVGWLMTITRHSIWTLWSVLVVALLTGLALELDVVVWTIESSAVFAVLSAQSVVVSLLAFIHAEATSSEGHVAWLASLAGHVA